VPHADSLISNVEHRPNLEVIRILVRAKCDINTRVWMQYSRMPHAVIRTKSCARVTVLHDAIVTSGTDRIIPLLRLKANINETMVSDKLGTLGSVLHAAVYCGTVQQIPILFEHGANPLIKDAATGSALMCAIKNRQAFVEPILQGAVRHVRLFYAYCVFKQLMTTDVMKHINDMLAPRLDTLQVQHKNQNALTLAAASSAKLFQSLLSKKAIPLPHGELRHLASCRKLFKTFMHCPAEIPGDVTRTCMTVMHATDRGHLACLRKLVRIKCNPNARHVSHPAHVPKRARRHE
jgi:hypothetical protein